MYTFPSFRVDDVVIFAHGSGRLTGTIVKLLGHDNMECPGPVTARERARAIIYVSRDGDGDGREYTRSVSLLEHASPAPATVQIPNTTKE